MACRAQDGELLGRPSVWLAHTCDVETDWLTTDQPAKQTDAGDSAESL